MVGTQERSRCRWSSGLIPIEFRLRLNVRGAWLLGFQSRSPERGFISLMTSGTPVIPLVENLVEEISIDKVWVEGVIGKCPNFSAGLKIRERMRAGLT
jgi:hypothetical protein